MAPRRASLAVSPVGAHRWRRLVRSVGLASALVGFGAALAVPTVAAAAPDIDLQRPEAGEQVILTPALVATLQRRLDRLLARDDMPGVSAAILFPDGTTWLGTSGMADVGKKRAVTPDTAFALASVSKTFTAALIMALRDEGKVDLAAPVLRYLPELRGSKRLNSKVTVRQLLDHTSGVRDFFFHAGIDHALLSDTGRRWSPKRALRYVGRPYFKPGKGWHYSNTNYLLLGLIAERVGKAPIGQQLEQRFFGPLGLTQTYDQVTAKPSGPVAHGYRFAPGKSRPIDLSDGSRMMPFTSVVTAAGAAGSLASTPRDLVTWVRALYDGKVVSPASLRLMFDDVAATAKRKPPIPYGLGVQGVELDGHPAWGHSGRLLGFRSLVRWLPKERIAIAVLSNQSRTDPTVVARSLLRLTLASLATPSSASCLAAAQASLGRPIRPGTSGCGNRVRTGRFLRAPHRPQCDLRSGALDADQRGRVSDGGDRIRHVRACRAAARLPRDIQRTAAGERELAGPGRSDAGSDGRRDDPERRRPHRHLR